MGDPTELVDWQLAQRVAGRVGARNLPQIDAETWQRIKDDFDELTPVAEKLVGEATGLVSLAGPARAHVTDRAGWASANVASFRRLLRPILDKAASSNGLGRSLPPPLQAVTRAAAGTELGVVLGWMSTRVLGQYDLFRADGADHAEELNGGTASANAASAKAASANGGQPNASPEDAVYFVGPNIIALERRHGFPAREFRLWIAVHELTHRAQFTGVPWMRGHFLSLVDKGISLAAPDTKQLLDILGRLANELRQRRNPLMDAGLPGVFAGIEQLQAIRDISGLMSLLEGHGDVIMNRAAGDHIAGSERFARTLQARRDSSRGLVRVIQQLIGLEAKMRQYKEGEGFVETVESAGGPNLFAQVWKEPENLPSMEEIRDPSRWVARIQARALESA